MDEHEQEDATTPNSNDSQCEIITPQPNETPETPLEHIASENQEGKTSEEKTTEDKTSEEKTSENKTSESKLSEEKMSEEQSADHVMSEADHVMSEKKSVSNGDSLHQERSREKCSSKEKDDSAAPENGCVGQLTFLHCELLHTMTIMLYYYLICYFNSDIW